MKIQVGFVQLNSSFSGQHYLPLATGMLQAYAQKFVAVPEAYEFALPICQFTPIDEAAERLSDCDIVAFSCYVWNEQNSLALAREYKRRRPDGVVVFGGPQVPNSHKQFRRQRSAVLTQQELQRERMNFTPMYHRCHPFIDMACHGEGERAFTKILDRMLVDRCADKSSLPSVSYVDETGQFFFNPEVGRMGDADLAQAPSPLTTGVFDKLIEASPDTRWILMYETDRGCPYSCSYCDWGGATEDRISKFPMEQVYDDIMWIGRNVPYVFMCNANFGILERDVQVAEFFAEAKARFGRLEGVSTQNAKNPKPHTLQALKVLERARLNKATVMSQQSLNIDTLKAVRRSNMQLDEYYAIQRKLAAEGVYTMTDLIIPMPDETRDSIIEGISTLISNGQHNRIQFNNLSILRNTEMGDPEYQRQFGMQIVQTPIINSHGRQNDSVSGVDEMQELVVATASMPPEEWRRTRAYCWMTNLVYFNKLLQVPALVVANMTGISFGRIFESFCLERHSGLPVLDEINRFFEKTALDLQEGRGGEYVHSSEWLDVFWPPEEYVFIKLVYEDKLSAFYDEARQVLEDLIRREQVDVATDLLEQSLRLNQSLIKVPFQTEDLELTLTYNIPDFFRDAVRGIPTSLHPTAPFDVIINRTSERWQTWADWCEKMVWFGNRRGAYLYGVEPAGTEIAGHH